MLFILTSQGRRAHTFAQTGFDQLHGTIVGLVLSDGSLWAVSGIIFDGIFIGSSHCGGKTEEGAACRRDSFEELIERGRTLKILHIEDYLLGIIASITLG
jgi:hypothetical protein